MKRQRVLLLLFLSISLAAYSQDFSNKGKDFWVAYGYHQVMLGGNSQQMVLYFATDQVTTVTVSIPGTGYSQTYPNIPAGTVFTSNPLPKVAGPQDARLFGESASGENKGIHIESDKPIVAYAHIYNANVSGATILFPTNTLGREYYSINYENISNSNNSNCWFYVIACDTGTTTVEIIPAANTLSHPAGVPFAVTLTQGQVYNVMGAYSGTSGVDLTGSKIRSIATASGTCKRIAVFSGSGRISITCSGGSASSDNYMVQSFPKNAWGKNYLTVPTGGGTSRNIYRICVSDPAAVVKLNGAPISYPLVNNFYYEIPAASNPLKIESDLPVTVAQYITSENACGNSGKGDPEVIYLSPVEQNISKVIWNATPNSNILSHYFSVVIPNSGTAISSFKLDGVPVSPSLFTVHPQDPAYSYLTQSVGAQQRKIESDSGFNAIAYGFGDFESYGYNAGTNVRDLYQRVGITALYSIEPSPSVCAGSIFKFKISLPYLVDSIRWDLSKLPGSPAPVLKKYSYPPVASDADSATIVNGKTIYWYSLDNFLNFNTTGTFPVNIIAYAASPEGCGNEQQVDFDLEVNPQPMTEINWVREDCIKLSFQFNNKSTTSRPTYKWWWDFGDPASGAANNSTLENPVHSFSAAGTYNVRFAAITTTGCLSDTITRQVQVFSLPIPAPNFSISDSLCLPAASVRFTDLSSIADGTESSFTYRWNFGDPVSGPADSSAFKNPMHIYSGTGPYNVKLQVRSGVGCLHDTTIALTSIHPQPKAKFDFSAPFICIGDSVGFIDQSTGGDGTVNTWQWTIGDGNRDSVPNPTHLYKSASTFQAGLYITNNFGCKSDTFTKSITVYPYPLVPSAPKKYVLEGGSIPLAIPFTGNNLTWLWEPGIYLNSNTIAAPVSTPLQDITYKVTASNAGGCKSSDIVLVKILKGPNIPNTFSPNGDGINEKWIIEYLYTYPDCKVKVFTRQGQLVFESRGYRTPWNGTIKGKTLPMDTYYYIIEPENGRKPLTGYVTIVK
jgi:gliding motility-associated-like protein